MTTIDITFNRAFRVWWSYTWRGLVLSPIVVVPLQIIVITWIVPHVRALGAAPAMGARLRELLDFMWVVCPLAIVGGILIHTLAIRWMLRRARWADFRLVATTL